MAIGMESETRGRPELNESLRMNPLSGHRPLTGGETGPERKELTVLTEPGWTRDSWLLAHPPLPSFSPRDASPFSGLPPPGQGTLGEKGACSLGGHWLSPSCLPSPEGKFALDGPEPSPQAVYICTYSVPQSSFLHLASIAQAREGERPCQSGPTPQRAPPSLPAPPLAPVCPQPQRPRGQRQKAGVGFALFCSSD